MRGKLHHRELDDEPYVTYERLEEWVTDRPLVLVSTGVERDSGDVHGTMRPRYLREHEERERRVGPMPPMVLTMSATWERVKADEGLATARVPLPRVSRRGTRRYPG